MFGACVPIIGVARCADDQALIFTDFFLGGKFIGELSSAFGNRVKLNKA